MRVLVLTRTHECLLAGGTLPDVAAPADGWPLRAVEAMLAAHGVRVPYPTASRIAADGRGGRDFVFVLGGERPAAPAGFTWRALRDAAADDALWSLYVDGMLGGWAPPTRAVDVWSFGNAPEMASRLVHMVACGRKRATAGWTRAAERSGVPRAVLGSVSVVTDGFGMPRVVLRTTTVEQRRFADIDASFAAAEGEGDLSYGDWREGHEAYFSREAAAYGLTFGPDDVIDLVHFELRCVVGNVDR
jgi:uncharacterized protein YhfF